jgi:hypothetical protein
MQLPNLGSPASAKLFVFLSSPVSIKFVIVVIIIIFFSQAWIIFFFFLMFLHFICLKKFS